MDYLFCEKEKYQLKISLEIRSKQLHSNYSLQFFSSSQLFQYFPRLDGDIQRGPENVYRRLKEMWKNTRRLMNLYLGERGLKWKWTEGQRWLHEHLDRSETSSFFFF